MKINWLKVTLILAGVAATPFVVLAILIGFWLYNSGPVHQPFNHQITLDKTSALIISGDYVKDEEEVRCFQTTKYEYQWWSDEDKRPVTELLETRESQDYVDACDTTDAKPRIVQMGRINSTRSLRVDDTVYSRLPQRGAVWQVRRFDPLHYRIERFSPNNKTIVLALRPDVVRAKTLTRLVMRADSSGNWKRDVRTSRQLSEPILYPFGRLKATFVWSRLPKGWNHALARWDGRGDLKARLRKLRAPILKIETKPFEQRTESVLPLGQGDIPNYPLRALAKWHKKRLISVHDTYGSWSGGRTNRWNFPADKSGASGPAAFIWLGQTSPFERANS